MLEVVRQEVAVSERNRMQACRVWGYCDFSR